MRKFALFLFILVFGLTFLSAQEDDLDWFLTNYQSKTPRDFITEINNMNNGQSLRLRLIVRYSPMMDYNTLFSTLNVGEAMIYSNGTDNVHFLYNFIIEYPSNDAYSFSMPIETPEWKRTDTSIANLFLGGYRELFIRINKSPEGLSWNFNAYRGVRLDNFGRVTSSSILYLIDWARYNAEYGYTYN